MTHPHHGQPEQPRAQIELSKELALALSRYDAAIMEAEAARIAVDVAFFPWAAGRVTNRDEARGQLAACGFLQAMEQAHGR